MLLALDTATRIMSLALHDGSSLIAEQTLQAGNQHTTLLANAIQKILATCEVKINDLTGLGVSIGPGSYTGLRIGVALAKGIASARKLPLVGVTTMDTLAAGHPPGSNKYDLITVVTAGRGRIIAQTYKWSKSRWAAKTKPVIMEWEFLFSQVEGQAYLTGDVDEQGRAALSKARDSGTPVVLTSAANRLRRAGFLAEEALRRLNEDKGDYSAAKVLPIYVQANEAEKSS